MILVVARRNHFPLSKLWSLLAHFSFRLFLVHLMSLPLKTIACEINSTLLTLGKRKQFQLHLTIVQRVKGTSMNPVRSTRSGDSKSIVKYVKNVRCSNAKVKLNFYEIGQSF